ncbi:FkbM family methyltransferase [Nocardioides stalactiti]|uniref:FkbM family methyltransferase n=1 Tax=Nocardioides stalactiti TaxID=2755356 RepID=UPI001601C566|nr:FkbM family methyltransferase [Nocardioides stalactiti]
MPPKLRDLPSNVRHHLGWWVRDRFPNRKVVREVQGVTMVLPWPHRLPDYAGDGPYGQNLVQLAAALAEPTSPVTVLDVGANVGDSALQILHATDAQILCVEADPYFLEYLHLNVDEDPRVAVVEALLTPDGKTEATTAVRTGGTTRFAEGEADDALPTVTPSQLIADFPSFANLRLVKSDTDGYDVTLVPAIAEAWGSARPVLFFEYDHRLSRIAGNDPVAVWPRLKELGYRDVAVWGNGGDALGRTTVDDIVARTAPLEERVGIRAQTYWDVAVVHADDAAGIAAIDGLVPATKRL